MDISRYMHQHTDILGGITALRQLSHRGIASHASGIASELKALSRTITAHLAIEDRILYPLLRRSGNEAVASMAQDYQDGMKGIANAFLKFARHWSDAATLSRDPEQFRNEANVVLHDVHARIARENREFYPTIEAL